MSLPTLKIHLANSINQNNAYIVKSYINLTATTCDFISHATVTTTILQVAREEPVINSQPPLH